MDPFSVVCGVAGLLGLAQVVVKEGYNYISTAKDTRDDILNLFNEVAALSGVLVVLRPVVDDLGNAGYSAGITKHQQISDCEDILQRLKTLLQKINPTPSINKNPPQNNSVSGVKDTHKAKKKLTEIKETVKNAVKIAKWPLSKDDTIGLMKRLERYKATFALTLSADSASKLMEVLDEVNETNHRLTSIRSEQDRVAEEKREEDRMTKLRWLFPGDPDEKHTDIRRKRHDDTGGWLFDTEDFKRWIQEPSWLFCHGRAGVGKTILTSAVIDHITNRPLHTSEDFGLAHIYCGFKDRDNQTPTKIFASILRQLGFQKTELPSEIKSLYEKFGKNGKFPLLQDLLDAITSLADSFSRVWLFFDALDECDETTLRDLLPCIKDLMKTNIKGFVTSRSHVSKIRNTFEKAIVIELSARREDIETFVRSRLSTRSVLLTPQLAEEIISQVLEKAGGIFLLAAFQVEFIIAKKRPKDIRNCLSQLPTGLDDIYKNILQTIKQGDKDNRELALNALSWISHATRPLHPKELCEALTIEEDDTEIDEDLIGENDLVDVCGGLVMIDEQSKTVRFVHYTVQEYLDKTDEVLRGAPAHARMAKTCLAYLSLDIFDERPAEMTVGFLRRRVNENAFYQYSACNWGYHTKSSGEEKSVLDMICKFSKTGNRTESALGVFFLGDFNPYVYDNAISNTRNTFLVAAIVGLPRLTQALLELRHLDADIKDTNHITDFDWATRRTPLSRAAEHGHLEVAQILVDRDDVVADSKDSGGQTPLSYAAMKGHLKVVQLLVGRDDVVADSKDIAGRTPLSYAAMKGHLKVVQLLVGRDDVEADSKDCWSQTPLSYAAMYGRLEVVQLLVGRDDVVADSKDIAGRTPLSYAIMDGYLEVVQLLVGRDDVVADSKDIAGRTPLSYAAMKGRLEVVQLLVGRDDVEADSKDSRDGQTPLSYAAMEGHLEVVQLLVSRDDVDANSKDNKGYTPLRRAEKKGHHEIAELLRSKAKPEAEESEESEESEIDLD